MPKRQVECMITRCNHMFCFHAGLHVKSSSCHLVCSRGRDLCKSVKLKKGGTHA